jgi:hypothetical protein
MKNNLLKFYITIIFFCSTTLLLAQAPGDTGDGSGGIEGADPAAPIDGYVWVLALIGLVYVFLRLRAFSKMIK